MSNKLSCFWRNVISERDAQMTFGRITSRRSTFVFEQMESEEEPLRISTLYSTDADDGSKVRGELVTLLRARRHQSRYESSMLHPNIHQSQKSIDTVTSGTHLRALSAANWVAPANLVYPVIKRETGSKEKRMSFVITSWPLIMHVRQSKRMFLMYFHNEMFM